MGANADASGSAQSAQKSAPMPIVQLSFDNSAGGAWDDRELIRMYDSAMKDFHSHHPGPGTWLDKATAAIAAGQAVPAEAGYEEEYDEEEYYDEEGYGDEDVDGGEEEEMELDMEEEDEEAANPSTTTPSIGPQLSINGIGSSNGSNPTAGPSKTPRQTHPAKRARFNRNRTNPYDSSDFPNPYASSSIPPSRLAEAAAASASGDGTRNQRRSSPSYAPGSPTGEEQQFGQSASGAFASAGSAPEGGIGGSNARSSSSRGQRQDYWERQGHEQGQAQEPGPSFGTAPAYGVQPTSGITPDAALSYAMTAQYWAGYWMGVAQAKGEGGGDVSNEGSQVVAGMSQGAVTGNPGGDDGAGGEDEGQTNQARRYSPSLPQSARERERESDAVEQLPNVVVSRKQFGFKQPNGLRR